jgi:hypothetical protein
MQARRRPEDDMAIELLTPSDYNSESKQHQRHQPQHPLIPNDAARAHEKEMAVAAHIDAVMARASDKNTYLRAPSLVNGNGGRGGGSGVGGGDSDTDSDEGGTITGRDDASWRRGGSARHRGGGGSGCGEQCCSVVRASARATVRGFLSVLHPGVWLVALTTAAASVVLWHAAPTATLIPVLAHLGGTAPTKPVPLGNATTTPTSSGPPTAPIGGGSGGNATAAVSTTRTTTTYTCGDGVHTCAYMWLALPSVFCACVIAGALVEVLVTSCARLTTAGTRLWAVNFYLRVCWQSLRSVKEKRMEEALRET